MKQTVMLLILAVLTTACSGSAHYGYKPEDPCIACGETWSFYPNETGGAISTVNRIVDCEHNWNCSE